MDATTAVRAAMARVRPGPSPRQNWATGKTANAVTLNWEARVIGLHRGDTVAGTDETGFGQWAERLDRKAALVAEQARLVAEMSR